MSNKDEVNSKAEDSPLRSESVLESFGAEFTVIDLNWSPEEEPDWSPEDEEENEDAEAEDEDELEQMDPNQLLLHTLATISMSAIEKREKRKRKRPKPKTEVQEYLEWSMEGV